MTYIYAKGIVLPHVETLHATSLRPNPRNQDVPQNMVCDIRRGTPCGHPNNRATTRVATTILLIIFFVSLLFNNAALAQSHQDGGADAEVVTPLLVGQKIPDMMWNEAFEVYNPKTKTSGEILLKDYKGKLIILDFWSSWCGPCVRSLPKLNKLSQTYRDDIEILLITQDSWTSIEGFHTKHIQGNYEQQIPYVRRSERLSSLFPARVLPHSVWIDHNGVVQCIAVGDIIIEENIVNLRR